MGPFVLAAFFLILIFFIVLSVLMTRDQADYFKMEIERAFEKEEREHWERELAKLYLYRIPFLGKWIYKIYVKKKYNKKV